METARSRAKKKTEEARIKALEEQKVTDIFKIASRVGGVINYKNILYAEAMRSTYDRINPVDLAKMDENEFYNFSQNYKKSIQRIVALTIEAQIENQ